MLFSSKSILKISEKRLNIFYSFGIVLIFTIAISLLTKYTSPKVPFILVVFFISLTLSYHIKSFLFFLILIIVTPKFAEVHHVIFFTLFLIPTIIFNYSNLIRYSVDNPLLKPLLLFIFLSSFSLLNAPKNIFTLLEYFNLIAFVVLLTLLPQVLIHLNNTQLLLKYFLSFLTIHSIYVIIVALSENLRSFGLLGVYYVDFAGLAFLYAFIFSLYSNGVKKLLFGKTAIINLIGLIFSQTRNAWISTFFIFFLILAFLFWNDKKYFIKRSRILKISLIFIILLVGFILLTISTKETTLERVKIESQTTELTDNTESVNENSFISRLFIWHTAINAFQKEPIIGIGLYNFKYTSHKYYTIPKPFFKQFVEKKTPHISFLEILVESGVVGFLGFLIFLISVISLSLKILKSYIYFEKEAVVQVLLISFTIFYVVISMIMTEAWLYGQYLVWFGIILGALVAENNRLLAANNRI